MAQVQGLPFGAGVEAGRCCAGAVVAEDLSVGATVGGGDVATCTTSLDSPSELQDIKAANMIASAVVRSKERGMVRLLANKIKVKLAYISQN